jgi:hypothetical protein
MQDELRRLYELDPENETFKEELVKLRWEKILEIRHTIKGLLATQGAKIGYEGDKEFKSFLWEDIFPQTKMFNIKIKEFLSDPKIGEILNSLASSQYTPPIKFKEVIIHLATLYAYYITIYEKALTLAEMSLDYSFAKLLFMAGMFYEDSLNKGHRELKRTKKGTKTRKDKAQKKIKHIVKIFFYVKNKVAEDRKTLSTMADAIKNDWINFPPEDEDIRKAPGLTLIKDVLMDNEKIRNEFEKVGRLWIIKM